MNVHWTKCEGGIWCKLHEVNLSHHHFDDLMGVYIIFYTPLNPQVVRVGQGFIRDRIEAHRLDPQVQHYADFGLYVTWASIPEGCLDGVEVFLAQHLQPFVGHNFPNVAPIPVNLPW